MVNLDNISYIEDSNGKKAVILSIETFERMRDRLKEMEDIEAYIKFKKEPSETFPISVVEQLILGNQSKIKTIRQYRGYNLTEFAKKIEISEAYLSQIENKKRIGSIKLYSSIAKALDIDLELISD